MNKKHLKILFLFILTAFLFLNPAIIYFIFDYMIIIELLGVGTILVSVYYYYMDYLILFFKKYCNKKES